jgi:hypothetical protein
MNRYVPVHHFRRCPASLDRPDTHAWYKSHGSFPAAWGKLRAARLREKHVQVWLRSTGYNPTKALGAVKRA